MTPSVPTPAQSGIDRLLEVVNRLRGEDGCPWDREQTASSLLPYMIEELYELVDAVEDGDPQGIREELGDVLMHLVLQARIGSEQRTFTFDDAAHEIAEKLVRRHPHVFGNARVSGPDEVLERWEAIKSREKGTVPRAALEGLPRRLPALQKAQRVQTRASRVGFDWDHAIDAAAKVREELDETLEAAAEGTPGQLDEEMGDLLFAVVNLSRFMGVDAEGALQRAVEKFRRRFSEVEKRIRAGGREPQDCTLAEMDVHWNAVKAEEQH